MLKENIKHNQWHHFSDFQFVDGEWVTWFYQDIETQNLSVRKDQRSEA